MQKQMNITIIVMLIMITNILYYGMLAHPVPLLQYYSLTPSEVRRIPARFLSNSETFSGAL